MQKKDTFFQKYSIEIWIFLSLWATYAYFFQGGDQNAAARFDTIRAFLDTGRFTVDQFAYNSADLISYEGHYLSSKAPGTFFLGTLPFAIFEDLFSQTWLSNKVQDQWITHLTTVFSVSALSAACSAFIYRFLRWFSMSASTAIVLALIYGLGTFVFPFSTLFFSHAATAALLFLSFYGIFRGSHCPEDQAATPLFLGGFCASFAVVMEYPAGVGAALLYAYALWKLFPLRRKKIFFLILGSSLGIVPLLLYNWFAFHQWFYIPYEAYVTAGKDAAFKGHSKGFLGIQNAFSNPSFIPALKEITFRPLRGFFYNDPILILALPGFVLAWMKGKFYRPELVLCFSMFLGFLYLNANFGDSVVYWGGGYSFGPRHLISSIPFLMLPLAYLYSEKRGKPWVISFMCVSVFICLMATAVEPRAPYSPSDPILQFYWPHFSHGQLALNTSGIFSNAFLTRDSVAFNWGKLVGLPASLQLFPLIFFWAWVSWKLRALALKANDAPSSFSAEA